MSSVDGTDAVERKIEMENCWSSVLGVVKGTGFHVQTERLGATGGKAESVETGSEMVTDWWLECVAMLWLLQCSQ